MALRTGSMTRRFTLWLAGGMICAAVVVCTPSVAAAHGATRSYSSWSSAGEQVRVTVRVPLLEFQRLLPLVRSWAPQATPTAPAFDHAVASYVHEHVTLYAGTVRCPGLAARPRSSNDPAYLVFTWEFTCTAPGVRRARVDLFFTTAPDHLHFLKWTTGNTIQAVLTSDRREVTLQGNGADGWGAHALRFTHLGITHVLTGADHLAFLLALLLLGGSLGWVVRVVTGFTVAHSVTLALSVLGIVRPPPDAVEALVGLSIAYVSLENFWLTGGSLVRRVILIALVLTQSALIVGVLMDFVAVPLVVAVGLGVFIFSYLPLLAQVPEAQRLRWVVAFLFGLVHGFAFAGFLLHMDVPTDHLALALASFNLGVEGGQLLVIAATWPMIALLHRGRWTTRTAVRVAHLGSTGTLLLGAVWFVTRAVSG